MTGENLQPNPEQDSIEELQLGLTGFTLIAQHNPKSPESRSLDLWQAEAASLRTDEDRIDHMQQRFKELLAGNDHLLPFYLMAQKDLNKS